MRRQRGNALVEFAVVVPLFVVLVYGATYLTDLGVWKLKAQEIARYGAFAVAAQPLSAYDAQDLRQSSHDDRFDEARARVQDEMAQRYFDLDGAVDHELATAGAWSKTMAAVYQAPNDADLRNQSVVVLPSWAHVDWAEPTSALGVVMSLLGFGTGTESLVERIGEALHFNRKGYVTVRADVKIFPPFRADDAASAHSLSRAGKPRGADLSEWDPRGQKIRDTEGDYIATTLVADSWRVSDGAPVLPSRPEGPMQNGVAEASEHAVEALPGGTLISLVLSFLKITEHIPQELLNVVGVPSQDPRAHVIALPYTRKREETAFRKRGGVLPGQIALFDFVDGDGESSSTVEVFETLPLYGTSTGNPKSDTRDMLNMRGNGFLGCPSSQKRGCWE